MFGRVLGDAYARLPTTVATLHGCDGARRYSGEIDVVRGRGMLSRLVALATRLPPHGRGRVDVDMVADAHGETWTRRVAGHAMRSRLHAHGGVLREQLGAVTFDFRLTVDEAGLHWHVDAVRIAGLGLPRRWFEHVTALESDVDDRYRFDVRAVLPVAGLLVHYHGWLHVG